MTAFNPANLVSEALISGLHLAIPFMVILVVYLTWRLFTGLFGWIIWKDINNLNALKILSEFIALFLVIFILSLFIIISSINWVNIQADPLLLAYNNQKLMDWDFKLFGNYVPFWLQSSANSFKPIIDSLTPIIIATYKNLTAILSLTLLIALAYYYKHFYRLLLAVVLTVMISVPLWLYLPALTPHEAFFDNTLKISIPTAIQTSLTLYEPNKDLKKYFTYIDYIKQENPAANQVVTTIPSLHIALGTLITYFAISAWPILAVLFIPYFIFNVASTMLTLQHYAVDALAGVMVAILAILISSLLIKKIDPEFDRDHTINGIIRADVKLIKKLFRK